MKTHQFNEWRTDRQTDHPRRDASGGWREEYRRQAVPVSDGGVREPGTPKPGDRVRDRDDRDDELVVVEVHNVRADEYTIKATGRTVADHNPEYPGWTPVVEAVYVSDLDATTAYRSVDELREAVEAGELRAYTFPAPRLGTLPDSEPEPEGGGEGE